jgi:N-methylhydantoinase B
MSAHATERRFDPVTAEVIRMGLEEIVEEMATVLTRTSGSPALTEAQDFSTALFDAKGEHIAYSGYVTLHMASSLLAVRSLLDEVPVESMRPGDAWLSNDPHVTGAMHPADWGLVTPLFADEALIGFAWSEAHLLDSGGNTPGSFGIGATDAYGEALRFPHIKFLDGGRYNTEVERILSNNVRVPTLVLNDIRSFVAANKVCEARLADLVHRHRMEDFERYVALLKDLSEQQLRERISRIPNGTWSTRDWQEHNGHRDDLFEQYGRLTVREDSIELWFDGDPQTDGLINGHYGALAGSVLTALCQLLFWDIPFNAGVLRCIEIGGEKGTVVNCVPPAPVSSAHMDSGMKVTKITTELISKALARSEDDELRSRASGQFQDCWSANIWYGIDQYDNPTVFVNMDGGGSGGGAQTVGDGLDVAATMCSPASSIPDIEINEQLYPVLFLWRGLYVDSGGPGTTRGGLGLDACWIPWETDGLVGTLNASCGAVAPRGSMGGYPPSTSTFAAVRDAGIVEKHFASGRVPTRAELVGAIEELPIKDTGVRIRAGGRDAFIYDLGGGAGLGDPLLRDPELVARDVRDRYVTREQADQAYGVVVQRDGTVDEAATEARRAQIRRERLGREPKPLTGADVRGRPIHLYLELVDGHVACRQCGERLGSEESWRRQAAVRRGELSEALGRYGAHALRHRKGSLLLEERFCPGCGTSLEVTTVLAAEVAGA